VAYKTKIHFEESESDLTTGIDENEFYDDDNSADGNNLTDEDVCLICGEYGNTANGAHCGHTRSAVSQIPLRAKVKLFLCFQLSTRP
jgi:hypothetical protein